MSKAFVKETDDEGDLPDEPPAIPPGIKNYMTPAGHRGMQDELRQLLRMEHPKVVETLAWAAGNGDRSENGDYIYGKRRLREIDRRIRFLSKRLERADVVDPNQQKKRDQVFFGATVTYATGRGTEMTITIVGVDEADLDCGQVSWLSPVARALMKARQGDIVELRAPAGIEQIEVLAIRYGIADNNQPGHLTHLELRLTGERVPAEGIVNRPQSCRSKAASQMSQKGRRFAYLRRNRAAG